jgi:predicted DNA-binding protein
MTQCKGRHTVTAKVDGETKESLDRDADRLGDFRADRIREAIGLYLELRRAEFECPHCNNNIQIQS